MRSPLTLFLLASLAVADEPEPRDFEVVPPTDEWSVLPPDRDDVQAYLKTEFADSNPKAIAEVRVMVVKATGTLASKGLDAIASEWATTIESDLGKPLNLAEGKATLGGEEAWFRDLKYEAAHLTWYLARRGKSLYVLHVFRTNRAVGDATLEEQIARIRDSFAFRRTVEEGPPKPPPIEDEALARTVMRFDHWRLECTKPEGLVNVAPEKFDEAERRNSVVAKFERTDGQTRIVVRIYAQSKSAQTSTIEELAARKVKLFEGRYDKAHRKPPERDEAWKPPLAEKAIVLKLTGQRTTLEITRWYLAQCRNDRQYQIEIYVAGAGEDRWSAQIGELVQGFRPLRE